MLTLQKMTNIEEKKVGSRWFHREIIMHSVNITQFRKAKAGIFNENNSKNSYLSSVNTIKALNRQDLNTFKFLIHNESEENSMIILIKSTFNNYNYHYSRQFLIS